MAIQQKQGWLEDPTGRHEFRYFSQGVPTSLVRDGDREANDAISINDREVFAEMSLAQPADTAPLLHQAPPKPQLESVFGGGIVNVNRGLPPNWGWVPAGPGLYTLALLPWLVGFPVCFVVGAPSAFFLALTAFSLMAVVAGATVRRMEASRVRRRQRPSIYRSEPEPD
jgi:hypothetical protein